MRDLISSSLKDAKDKGDKRRCATLRLMMTAIRDRDAAARDASGDAIADEEILDILRKMVQQRAVSSREFEEAGQLERAEQERQESAIIQEFLPLQISEEEVRTICQDLVNDINAQGLRDIGRCMSALKQRYPGKMDFAQASSVVKNLLRTESLGKETG